MVVWAVFIWIALCVIVGVAANTRGRNSLGWFLCAVVISPLLGGLLLALPKLEEQFATGSIRSEAWFEERHRRRAIVSRVTAAMLVAAAAFVVWWGFF
jgi:hypothetical protein